MKTMHSKNKKKKMKDRHLKDKLPFKQLTKGKITEHAIEYLTLIGFDCWPENNTTPVRHRHFTGRKGKPDIIGFGVRGMKCGLFLGCEVKTINDEFSYWQIEFLNGLANASGAAYVAYQSKEGRTIIETWVEYLLKFSDRIEAIIKKHKTEKLNKK